MVQLSYPQQAVLYRACTEDFVRTRGAGASVGTGVAQELVALGLVSTEDGVLFRPTSQGTGIIERMGVPEKPKQPPPRVILEEDLRIARQDNALAELAMLRDCVANSDCVICAGAGYNDPGTDIWAWGSYRSIHREGRAYDCWCCYGAGTASRAHWYEIMVEAARQRLEAIAYG